jgi:signal transduction histidine kinase
VKVPAAPLPVSGDPVRLGQIFENLLSNAVKYTPDDGCVDVVLESVDDLVRLSVRDTGIGISADDQDRLFEEFFRSADPEARSRPGTGLGLAIVARVVERAGGTITVQSARGAGSTFLVELPATPEA